MTHLNPKRNRYQGKKILVTGGLGFIGSQLSIQLIREGASVTILDASLPDHGANPFNVHTIKTESNLTIIAGSILDESLLRRAIASQEIIFHLAGEQDHVRGLTDAEPDILHNILGTFRVLAAIRAVAPDAKLIYSSTRGEYGPVTVSPVPESTPLNPQGAHEITKMAAASLVALYARAHRQSAVILRLGNIYGPHAQVHHSRSGVINWLVGQAVLGNSLTVMGTGKILRDFLHVDDCVEAFLLSGLYAKESYPSIFNIGHPQPSCYREVTEILHQLSHVPVVYQPFSPERLKVEPGDFVPDITKAKHELGWNPKVDLISGLASFYQWLKKHRSHYLGDQEPQKRVA